MKHKLEEIGPNSAENKAIEDFVDNKSMQFSSGETGMYLVNGVAITLTAGVMYTHDELERMAKAATKEAKASLKQTKAIKI